MRLNCKTSLENSKLGRARSDEPPLKPIDPENAVNTLRVFQNFGKLRKSGRVRRAYLKRRNRIPSSWNFDSAPSLLSKTVLSSASEKERPQKRRRFYRIY